MSESCQIATRQTEDHYPQVAILARIVAPSWSVQVCLPSTTHSSSQKIFHRMARWNPQVKQCWLVASLLTFRPDNKNQSTRTSKLTNRCCCCYSSTSEPFASTTFQRTSSKSKHHHHHRQPMKGPPKSSSKEH
jgi:hypothetical protein